MAKPKTIRCVDCGKAIQTHPYETTMETVTYSVCDNCKGPEVSYKSLFLDTAASKLSFKLAMDKGLENASR